MGITREMLDECFDTAKLAESIWERMQRLRSRAESTTPGYGLIGGRGGSVSDKVGNNVAALDKLMRQFEAETDRYAILAADVNEAIQMLEEPILRNIMGLRYLDGLNWDDVADKAGHSERQCYRLHNNALEAMGIETGKDVSECQLEM